MIRDITLGQYYPSESVIHRLDSRVKIWGTFVYIIGLFVVNNFAGFAIAGFALCSLILISKVPVGFIVKGLKPVFIIILFTLFVNMFMTGGTVLWQIGFLKFTKEGIWNAAFMCIRLILLIFGSSMLTLTTKPIQLTDGIEYLLNPLRRFGVPAHELAMMMSIALRFIPTLLEETDKIMKAQVARGADFESGSLLRRAKSLIPILVPLFISAFRIALDLAMAMEARCYRGGGKRTRLHEMRFQKRDIVASVIIILFIVSIVLQSYVL